MASAVATEEPLIAANTAVASTPATGRPLGIRQQRCAILGQHPRVQRDVPVGEVEGLAAQSGLSIHGASGIHETRHIGDRVPHLVTGAGALQMEGLVEISGAEGIECDERHVAQVEVGSRRAGRLCFGDRLGRELDGRLDVHSQRCERLRELALRGGRGDM